MFLNLNIEMLRKGVDLNDIAKAIGKHRNTASEKINGKRPFTVPEAQEIKRSLFPDKTIEYLFATEQDQTDKAS